MKPERCMRIARLFVLLLCCLVTSFLAQAAERIALDGTVYDAVSRQGIASLTLKLIPPTDAPIPVRATFTDGLGRFRFPNVEPGRYLLEVHQGSTLVYRDVVSLQQTTRKDIGLRRIAR